MGRLFGLSVAGNLAMVRLRWTFAGLTIIAAGTPSASVAQYVYGTNSAGGSCIANGVDCGAAPTYGGGGGGGARRARRYAAFAATRYDGTYFGYSFGKSSRASAENAALAECNKQAGRANQCEVATWFYNMCGALAISQNGAWGVKWSASLARARKVALDNCISVKTAKECRVVKSFCT